MIDVGISEFRANMNTFLQQVQNGEVLSLQLRGKEIAKIVPPDFAQAAARQELETLRETAVVGEVLTPVDEMWQAGPRIVIAVDTHILIWDALSPERLSAAATEALAAANRADGVIVADITLWEIAMLVQKARVQIDTDCHALLNLILQANSIHVQPITPQIAARSTQLLSSINADPADRLIVATALAAGVPLVTADRNLRGSDEIVTVW